MDMKDELLIKWTEEVEKFRLVRAVTNAHTPCLHTKFEVALQREVVYRQKIIDAYETVPHCPPEVLDELKSQQTAARLQLHLVVYEPVTFREIVVRPLPSEAVALKIACVQCVGFYGAIRAENQGRSSCSPKMPKEQLIPLLEKERKLLCEQFTLFRRDMVFISHMDKSRWEKQLVLHHTLEQLAQEAWVQLDFILGKHDPNAPLPIKKK